jgi:hypothetical protein
MSMYEHWRSGGIPMSGGGTGVLAGSAPVAGMVRPARMAARALACGRLRAILAAYLATNILIFHANRLLPRTRVYGITELQS